MRPIVGILVAALAVGCGASMGSSSGGARAAAKPEEAAILPPAQARDVRPGELEVTVSGPRWIGPLRDEHVSEYPLVLMVRNTTREPLRIGPALASVDVFEGARPVPGCDGTVRVVDLPEVLAPSATANVRVSLPCALEAPSEYDVVVELIAGEDDVREASLLDARFSGSTPLHVDDDIGPYGADVIPTATIYAPHPGTLPTPVPMDVRPESEETPSAPSGAR